jgi:hypothetical protein
MGEESSNDPCFTLHGIEIAVPVSPTQRQTDNEMV